MEWGWDAGESPQQQPLKRAEPNHHLTESEEAPNPKINPIRARGGKKAQIGFILGFASGDASPLPSGGEPALGRGFGAEVRLCAPSGLI